MYMYIAATNWFNSAIYDFIYQKNFIHLNSQRRDYPAVKLTSSTIQHLTILKANFGKNGVNHSVNFKWGTKSRLLLCLLNRLYTRKIIIDDVNDNGILGQLLHEGLRSTQTRGQNLLNINLHN